MDAKPLVRNTVKEKLARNELVTSVTVRLVGHANIAAIVHTMGFDTFYVDMEHSSITADATSQVCGAALNLGIPPFVRVGQLDEGTIAGVLDGGALGVIAPQVGSAGQAMAIVAAAKYPPFGRRSVSSTLPQLFFRNLPLDEWVPAVNDATMVVPMVESVEGLNEIDAIAGTVGVDMVLIGSNDLTTDLGVAGQYGHLRFQDACSRIIESCLAQGKAVGIGGIGIKRYPEIVSDFLSQGVRYVSSSTDLGLLMSAGEEWMRGFKEIIPSGIT